MTKRVAISLLALGLMTGPALAGDADAVVPQQTPGIGSQYSAILSETRKNSEITHERNIAMLDHAERMMDRQEQLIGRQEKIIARQEAAEDRYEKILSTWESQQAEYQKYLDSLKGGAKSGK